MHRDTRTETEEGPCGGNGPGRSVPVRSGLVGSVQAIGRDGEQAACVGC